MTDHIIEADAIEKSYGENKALDRVSLQVAHGSFLALVGPSGCGKTTLLKMLAGFEEPTGGSLRMSGQSMAGVPPQERPARMVFQRLALFPHRTVAENIGFPLKVGSHARADIRRRVGEMMAMMRLDEAYRHRYPAQLSGGEQQRVALARAIISEPDVLLLDEPLSALDAKLKKSLQAELKHLHREMGTTFVHVTHDLEEAMVLADRICVMRAGNAVQLGRPSDIYYRPLDSFVAGFIGETNLIPVQVAPGYKDGLDVHSPLFGRASMQIARKQSTITSGGGVLTVRPERVSLAAQHPDGRDDIRVAARVRERFNKGATIQFRVVPHAEPERDLVVEIQGTERPPADVDADVQLAWRAEDCYVMER